MKHIIKRHTISFMNAFNGLVWAIQTQPNYKIHIGLSFVVIIGGIFLNLTYGEWLMIVLLIILGLVIETVNTAIEVATDSIDLKQREDIKIAKDVSAAAMLVFAIGAIIMAFIIFFPKIIAFFNL